MPLPPDALPAPGPFAQGAPPPLRGIVVLAVEDSRFAAEALRLVCQRSGARLRRAETLADARRHLRAYRPDVVLVDLGLPDGRGEALIRDLARSGGWPVVLAMSADPDGAAAARAAGAAAFIDKPIVGLAAFLGAILPHLPDHAGDHADLAAPPAPAPLAPDRLALRDDLARAAALLARPPADAPPGHAAAFVQGLARSAGDTGLESAARAARADPTHLPALRRIVAQRLSTTPQGILP